MTSTEPLSTHGSARIPNDDVLSRSMRVFKTVAEVNRAWDSAGLPGEAEVTQQRIANGEINPPEIISHRVALSDAPEMYELFETQKDECTKVVLKP